MEAKKPNWDYWGKLKTAKLFEAVCLTLGVAPAASVFNDPPAWQRLDIAKNHMAAVGNRPLWVKAGPEQRAGDPEAQVILADFFGWAIDIGWTLPPELLAIASRDEQPAPGSRWPWGAHHTQLLGHLEAAAIRFWGADYYDPADKGTAPQNKDIEKWLETERELDSDAMRKAIATILRLDGLPTGPRSK